MLFCLEVLMTIGSNGDKQIAYKVNNSCTVFCVENTSLEFLIDSCLLIGGRLEKIGKLDIGTRFLTGLRQLGVCCL